MDAVCLGERFRHLREESGFTQERVARFLGIEPSYILEFEEGRRELGLCLLLKACCLFGCPIQAFKDLEMEFEPLTSSLQVYTLSDNDLEALADVNRIALNLMDIEVLANGSEVC